MASVLDATTGSATALQGNIGTMTVVTADETTAEEQTTMRLDGLETIRTVLLGEIVTTIKAIDTVIDEEQALKAGKGTTAAGEHRTEVTTASEGVAEVAVRQTGLPEMGETDHEEMTETTRDVLGIAETMGETGEKTTRMTPMAYLQ